MDFLLVAELGRVLLFSWEELELFSSSSSSSSSKLMLLETPGPQRSGKGRVVTQARPVTGSQALSHPHVQNCMYTCASTHSHTQPDAHKDTFSLVRTRAGAGHYPQVQPPSQLRPSDPPSLAVRVPCLRVASPELS